MKKFGLLCSALLCSALLCSPVVYGDVSKQVEEYGVNDLEGVVVGIDLGCSHSSLKNERYVKEFPLIVGGLFYSVDTSEIVEHKRCTADISINVGYSHFYKNLYLGASGEFSLGQNNNKYVTLDEDFPTKSKISGFSSAFKLKGGYYFKDLNAAIYGIAGLKWRNVEMQYNYSYQTVSAVGSKAKLSTPLYTVGIGIERPIYKKLSFSAEYEYTWKNSKDISEVKPNGVPFRFYIKQRLKEHSFKIGIKYHI